ncbi:hypothetical protein RJ639_033220 [Escallonia herrerae]|uniref:Uncharacterized protein n=1 Tax=Escallonia herrerae TaxID=1293975 RepID=A0AA88WUW0_9ASTE|nr:hypothetical protein RJ639_033220 [Escallonia herrerae]
MFGQNLFGQRHPARAECSDGILFGQNLFGQDHSARAECSDGIRFRQNLFGQDHYARQSVWTGFYSDRICSASVTMLVQSVRTEFCSGMNLLGQAHSARAECSDGILLGRVPPPSTSQPLPPSSSQPPQPSTSQPSHSLSGKNALEDVKDQAEDKANPKPWYTADEKSGKMSTEDLQELIREYSLPEGWYARLPGLQEPANYGTKFETVIYEEQVKSGYRLPLHPFALRFFEHYHMAPGQLVPNGVANCPGWYYIHSRQRLLKGGPKSNKGWHSRYFFVGLLDKGKLPFDRDWNPYCKDFENPGKPIPNNLTKHILSHIKLRGGLSIDEPLSKEQLEWAKIIPPKPIPAGLLLPPPPPAIPRVSSAETVPLEMASESGKSPQGGFLGVLQKAKGKRKEKQPSLGAGSSSWNSSLRQGGLQESDTRDLCLLLRPGHVAAEEAHQKREAIKEAPEATHRAEELSKQEVDHLAQILTLEKRLERAKRRAAEEDGLKIYELGFAKAKEMFTERFPDIPLDDLVLPAMISLSGETVLPSEVGDAATSHPSGENPSGDAPEP